MLCSGCHGHTQNEPNITFQFHPWSDSWISFFFYPIFCCCNFDTAVYKLLKKLLRFCAIWDQFLLNVNFFLQVYGDKIFWIHIVLVWKMNEAKCFIISSGCKSVSGMFPWNLQKLSHITKSNNSIVLLFFCWVLNLYLHYGINFKQDYTTVTAAWTITIIRWCTTFQTNTCIRYPNN